MSATLPFGSRLAEFEQWDAERQQWIADRLRELVDAQQRIKGLDVDLEAHKNHSLRLQEKVAGLERDANAMNQRPYVVVLLDADADDYVFHESFLSRGEEGGNEAADRLRAKVKEHALEVEGLPETVDIALKAFANVNGLAEALVRYGKIGTVGDFRTFVCGFTNRYGLFDFVDVGANRDKDRADNKIRESLQFHISSWQCKHVFLGCCHDTGYPSFLGQFAGNPATASKVTLLQGVHSSPRFQEIGFKKFVSFDGLFASPKSTPEVIVPRRRQSPQPTGFPYKNAYAKDCSIRLGPVRIDERGFRLDKSITVDPAVKEAIRKNKLCFYLNLRGECEDVRCKNTHTQLQLGKKEYMALWSLARSGKCNKARKGILCEDSKCIYRHED